MNKIIVRRSIVGWLIFAGLGLLIMINEYVSANYHFNGIALLGAAVFIASLVQLLFTKPQVIIDEEGVSAVVLGKRKFLWKEIREAELRHMHRSGYKITLTLHDNSQHSFILFGVNVSAHDVHSMITNNIRKFGCNIAKQSEDQDEDN